MQTATTPNSMSVTKSTTAVGRLWLMLFSRSALFLLSQGLIALILMAAGTKSAWDEAARWWIFFPIFANVGSILLLIYCFRAEGKRYLDLLRFNRATVKTDLLWFFGSGLIGFPIASLPMNLLGQAIFGDPMTPIHMLFRPLPIWALVVGLLFPATMAFAEMPTYFGYSMPRLFNGKSPWLAFIVASVFLSLQHIFIPTIADWNYILWRGLMYLPFALYAGLMVKLRPNLLPYFAIVHALMDVSVLTVYLTL
jgi:membrane protease YdiL (CAAX protease family)